MPLYSIQGPDGKTYNIEGPEGATREQVIDAIQFKMRQQPAPEETGVFRQALDLPVQAGKGVFMGVRFLTDIFGADNPVSQSIRGVEDYMDSLLSAQAKNDQQEIARIMAEAEDKGVLDKVIAGAKAFAVAPADMMAQALGTAAPTVAGGLYGAMMKLGTWGVRGIQAGIGAVTGAGVVKSSIYDAVKDALIEAGESPEVAEKKAAEAQAYTGDNWGSILTGTALGGLAGSTGIEKAIVDRFIAKETAKGVARRAVEGGVKELTPEFFQAAQEQVAANLALQKEGFDVDTFRGAIEQGTLEGLAGFGLGAGIEAVTGKRRPKEASPTPPAEPKVVQTNTYDIIDFDGSPSQVTVTQDDAGNIVATDVNGEQVDLTNIVSRGLSLEDAIKSAFSPEDAPIPTIAKPIEAPEVVPEAAPEAAPEVAPEAPKAAPPTAEVELPEVAPPPVLEEAPPVPEIQPPEAPPPAPLSEAVTGQPFTYEGFRGEGKPKEEIYAGPAVPVVGEGRYVADTEESARIYGDQVAPETVTLNNPLVIKTDDEWRALTRAAGWQFPNPSGLPEPDVKQMTDALARLVQGQGYDGIVVNMRPDDDSGKTLWNVFGHPQVISYAPKAEVAPEVKPKAPPEAKPVKSIFSEAPEPLDALPEFPSIDDRLRFYFTKNKNVQPTDVVVFDDVVFFKQPDGRYNSNPDGTGGEEFASFDDIQETVASMFGEPLETFLIPPKNFDAYSKISQPKPEAKPKPKAPKKPKAPEIPVEPTEAEKSGRINATPAERKVAEKASEKSLGEVVWQQGKLSLIRTSDPKYGQVQYSLYEGSKKIATDISRYTGTQVTPELKRRLREISAELEDETFSKHRANPYVKFSQGISVSDSIDPRIEAILRGWRSEIGIDAKIHITTMQDLKKNRNKYTGPHRTIVGGARKEGVAGFMQRWSDGNYYIVFTDSTSKTSMLETIAHELGHIHEREVFQKTDAKTRDEIMSAYRRWLAKNRTKNIGDFINALRSKTAAQTTIRKLSPDMAGRPAEGLTPYWKSFSEWYADQVARWAVSDEKPVGIVEQFFARLGKALRKFYQTIKGQGFLPDETFRQYLNNIKNRARIAPATLGEASRIESEEFLPAQPQMPFSEMLKKLPPGRSEELRQAAIAVSEGKMTAKEFDDMVNRYKPIVARTAVPAPKTEAEMKGALNVNQREKVNPPIAENTPVGLRLDINATNKGVPVVTIHTKRPGGIYSVSTGKVIGFKSTGKLKDVVFAPGKPSEALEMAMGRKKEPLQTMEGRWVNASSEQAYNEALNAFTSPEWTQIGVDPTRHSYFYDKSNTQPVVSADEVIQIGDVVLAKNVKYAAKEEFLYAEKDVKAKRSPELQDAAKQLRDGLITRDEYDALVQQYKPIRVPTGVRTPNTQEEVVNILKANQKPSAFPEIADDTKVGLRLDIDSTTKGVPVVAIHEPKPSIRSGKQPIIGYDSVARITDVEFAVGSMTMQKRAQGISAGEQYKEPMQTMEGSWKNITPEEAYRTAQAALSNPAWTQVGVDPERHAFFYDKKNVRPVVSADEVIQIGDQVFAKNVQYAPREEFLFSQTLTDDAKGKIALDVVNTLGRGAKPEKTSLEKLKGAILDDRGNLKINSENAKKQATKFIDQLETWAFSTDAALNNAIRRTITDTTMSQKEKIGVLLSISSSQAVHADAVASLFMRYGGVKYNPEIYKYEAVDKDNNLISLVKAIDNLAKTYKMTTEEAERVAHTAFEAKRLRSMQEFNKGIDAQVEELKARIAIARAEGDLSTKKLLENELRKTMRNYKFIHMTDEEITAGLSLIEMMPNEMQQIIDTWNGIRQNAAEQLIESGLWSPEEAEILLSNMDYVPFYREDQLEQGRGPKEFLRSLQVQAKEKKLKGSKLAVNDIFDNMARWTQYAIKRSVMNRLAVAKIDAAVDAGIAKKVSEEKKGKDSVRVWRDGVAEYYNLDDPMFMDAFAGLESVAIPAWKIASKFSNFLRQSVVLNPLFSIAQVPQDAFAAIYSSGLKPRYALTIPIRAVKEFILTIGKASQTHKELERIGAVGIRDFSAAVARTDAEVLAGLKSRPGIKNKVMSALEHFSMASDNAIRQAVFSAAIDQGLSRGEAIEKAFQLINFRNRGSSKVLQLAGQVIPFFNAYLAAQHVAIKTISGVGISPGDRKEALKTLAYTTSAMITLSLIYSMMMDDDEEYKNTPSIIRDRLLMIPGVKMSIPIRPDFFSIPKILTEHTYMMMTNQGAADGRKFRDSMAAALGNALFSPTVVPQAVKPLVEVGINYNFFQGRPLIGTYQKGLETERQFNDSTSELGKFLGSSGIISPIAADHLIRGMLGSVGGLTLYLTNGVLHNDPSVPRPEMTVREALAGIPGTSGFIRREYETGLKNDFYVLRDEVSKAVNTLNDLKARSPHEIEKFLTDEKNINRIGLQKAVNKITEDLSKIRREISRITQLPSSEMSAKEKQENIRELKMIEQEMLSGINIKELRSMAQL